MFEVEAQILRLYEHSVQSPKWQVGYLPQFHRMWLGQKPVRFREDFSGSGLISCEWVKLDKKHQALGLDFDGDCIRYAQKVNQARLTPDQQSRVQFLKKDVLKQRGGSFDWVGAFNYSAFVFHERAELLRYFKNVYRSLAMKGSFFVEVAGGPGFIQPDVVQKNVRVPGLGKVTHVWEQHGMDPITQVADYSMHFQLPSGEWLNDAFRYHWRIWSPRELRELLSEAGFQQSFVLLEKTTTRGRALGELEVREEAELTPTWVGYIVGIKKPVRQKR